ncbi:MAG: NAD(P)-dependent glycerol-3-phosphate dehydrogenase [Candidatus Omnitrophica bacterium]|nr:NAD(P)-dependent glycerol-3-phosphate dehydrogenase [Candidatus Omnitrophota bacterium]MDD5487451.1 NAD(P)-dependent glycerol-3-phosphate dehydrogenase [Candidatus Omnitrophota bacterium]
MSKVTVIGDGGWGTALAILLDSKGIETTLWSFSPEYADYIDKHRENPKFLKGIRIPKGIKVTSEVSEASGSGYAVFVVPCEYLGQTAKRFIAADFKNVISATKGIEYDTLMRPSEILSGLFPNTEIGALSGPSIAYEVAQKVPTAVVLAGSRGHMKEAQEILTTDRFRIYTSDDITGVELGGALKNVIAIAAGISDGLGFGTNTKAAILTRGLAEITRLGERMGAKADTFRGLSGMGDLATTCISPRSRNRWLGEELGKGRSAREVLEGTEMVVEGAATCRAVRQLADKYNVEMPISSKVYEVIYEGKNAAEAVTELMTRDLKIED